MSLTRADFLRILETESLPAAVVDLDALDRNVDRLRQQVRGTGKTLRVATKSVRHVGLLRRILERGGDDFVGLMCFTVAEAAYLAGQEFDDLLVAYPSVRGLDAVAQCVGDGKTIRLMVDDVAHLDACAEAAERAQVVLDVVIDLDVSYDLLGVHLGPQRSPLRTADQIANLARRALDYPALRVVGVMGYEALIAGIPDDSPFTRAKNPIVRALKRVSLPRVAEVRAAAVEALRALGVTPTLVNGGGTGSVATTVREACVTEVTAGSGFLCPHLFDHYRGSALEPAAFFALEVSRRPGPGFATCLGGGYIASGAPDLDRLPLPWLPRGLEYVAGEGAGEVQTPLRVSPGVRLEVGEPAIFRHAKAGELAERFNEYLLVRGAAVQAREPTYRGAGQCFL